MTQYGCRFCRAALPAPILDLGLQPLSNAYITIDELAREVEQKYPLRIRVCEECHLVQADDFATPETIFNKEYAYFSSYSDSWLAHCQEYANQAIHRFHLTSASMVIEVASNDGYLLQFFKEAGIPTLGVEPTANTAAVARSKGIPTEERFFDDDAGRDLAARGFSADLIHGANVLAHVPDILGFVSGFRHILHPQGTVTLEFPHLLRMIEQTQFDTIYHEHFSYLSLTVVERILRSAGLRIYDVEQLATHGGSLRLFCCHEASHHTTLEAVGHMRETEVEAGLSMISTYTDFAQRVTAVRQEFQTFLTQARQTGRIVAAYGAAAKGNTFLNFCDTTADDIVCVFDRNPQKQDRMLPGSHVPVLDPARVHEIRPDLLLILPWNLKSEIIAQMSFVRQWGCRFVTAIPAIEILS